MHNVAKINTIIKVTTRRTPNAIITDTPGCTAIYRRGLNANRAVTDVRLIKIYIAVTIFLGDSNKLNYCYNQLLNRVTSVQYCVVDAYRQNVLTQPSQRNVNVPSLNATVPAYFKYV